MLPTIRGIQTRKRSGWRLRSGGEVTSASMPSQLRARGAFLGKRPKSPLDTGSTHSTHPIDSHLSRNMGLQLIFRIESQTLATSFNQSTLVSVHFWVGPGCFLIQYFPSVPVVVSPLSLSLYYFLSCCCLTTLGTFCSLDERA